MSRSVVSGSTETGSIALHHRRRLLTTLTFARPRVGQSLLVDGLQRITLGNPSSTRPSAIAVGTCLLKGTPRLPRPNTTAVECPSETRNLIEVTQRTDAAQRRANSLSGFERMTIVRSEPRSSKQESSRFKDPHTRKVELIIVIILRRVFQYMTATVLAHKTAHAIRSKAAGPAARALRVPGSDFDRISHRQCNWQPVSLYC